MIEGSARLGENGADDSEGKPVIVVRDTPYAQKQPWIETAHYCEECNRNLSLTNAKTDQEKEFIKARAWRDRRPVDYTQAARTAHGICDGCGQVTVVEFYRISP